MDISISVIQWLLNADSTAHSPQQRLTRFFTTLHAALKNPSRAVFQFYPSSDDQVHMITSAAQKAGFGGGLVVDYPNSRKARKMYLVLMVGSQGEQVPRALDGTPAEVVDRGRMRDEVQNEKKRRKSEGKKGGKKGKKDLVGKEWIMKKKELYRTRGKEGYVLLSRTFKAEEPAGCRWLSAHATVSRPLGERLVASKMYLSIGPPMLTLAVSLATRNTPPGSVASSSETAAPPSSCLHSSTHQQTCCTIYASATLRAIRGSEFQGTARHLRPRYML